ncbi:MAG: hypothetical protein EOO32_00155 [Comamonadaceae bacterium]|nr:MAG: hypothetical protein EOO32_00155 [Comamonadaceae bacterium]
MPTIKITDATAEPFALAEAKTHLRVTLVDPQNDAHIEGLITVARQAAEDRMQRTLLSTTWQLSLQAFPRGAVTLLKPRIQSVENIHYLDVEGVQQTLPANAYVLDTASEAGQLAPTPGSAWPATRPQPGAVRITYVAGYASADEIPKPIVQWIKLALTDLYVSRSRSSERPALPQDFADGLLATYEVQVL